MFDLSDKAVLFAGGAGYLGSPGCRRLVEHGASVAIADSNLDTLGERAKQLQDEFGEERVLGVPFDIEEEESIRGTVAKAADHFGRLDVLVVATNLSIGKKVEDLQADEFQRTNRANIVGFFLLAREAAARMESGGSVILFSSMYGMVSPDPRIYDPPRNPNPIEYGASKAAINQMVRYLAGHYGPHGIRVNGISPGPFPHPDKDAADPEFVKRLASRTMLGRIGRQDETAGPVVFLASDESSYVTGHILCVDGGWTAW